MIKIDYLIERQEGNRITKYKPTLIPTELPNVVCIQGPNSSGKSTLLNMIALAFFGQKLSSDELNQGLKERLDNLMDSEHQKIQFKIEVDNEALGARFLSQKSRLDSKEIILKDFSRGKGVLISPDSFKREYKLIYDIPNNPLERLPLLLNTLRTDQKEVGLEIDKFQSQLLKVIDEIKEARNPDLLKRLRERQRLDQVEYGAKKKTLDEELQRHKKLMQYFKARFYLHYKQEKSQITYSINRITRHFGQKQRQQSKEDKKKISIYNELEDRIKQAEEIIESLKSHLPNLLPKNQMWRYKLWAEADIQNEIFHNDIYDVLRKQSESLNEYLSDVSFTEKKKHQNELAHVNLLRDLILTLEAYRNHTIPVVNLSIKDFIKSLSTDLSKYQDKTARLENIEKCAKLLERLLDVVDEAINFTKDLKAISKKHEIVDNEELSRQQELERLESKITGIAEKAEEYRTAIVQEGLDPDKASQVYSKLKSDSEIKLYEIYNESQLDEKVKASAITCESLQEDCKILIKRIEGTDSEIKRFEEKKPHKYQDNYIVINQLLNHVLNLRKQFGSFDNTLKKMIDNAIKHDNLSRDDRRYSEAIGEYLAKKIGTLLHISNIYKTKNIDVIAKKITTDTGTVIRFADLGTGQGQAAYLDTLLSMSANKKIIALFDEVAMMDEGSLKPVKARLKQLYDANKLLMAVIVQKGEDVKVESMI